MRSQAPGTTRRIWKPTPNEVEAPGIESWGAKLAGPVEILEVKAPIVGGLNAGEPFFFVREQSEAYLALMAPSDEVTLEPIPKDQASVLDNLVELYAHDFSEHVPLQLKSSGRFDVALSDKWWTESHFPFFIRWKGQLAGFALVRKGSRVTDAADVMDVAEFFVARGFRKKKVGTIAAQAIFMAFPGGWDIRVRQTNTAAKIFWARVAEAWVGRAVPSVPFSTEGVEWNVFHLPPTSL